MPPAIQDAYAVLEPSKGSAKNMFTSYRSSKQQNILKSTVKLEPGRVVPASRHIGRLPLALKPADNLSFTPDRDRFSIRISMSLYPHPKEESTSSRKEKAWKIIP